jgi:DNA-binding MarR family transcriptional regulator
MEPLLTGILVYGNVDKVYLLHSDHTFTKAKKLKDKLEGFDIKVLFRRIDIFSIDEIANHITQIARDELNNSLFINITGGTNLMAGAACASAYFVGAQAYYIRDRRQMPPATSKRELLIEIPVPNIRYNEALDKQQLTILQLLSKHNGPSTTRLLRQEGLNMSGQNLSYHLKQLVHKRLIKLTTSERDSRLNEISLTDVGKLVLAWSKN